MKREALETRIEKAEYKITDLIECIRLIVSTSEISDEDMKQIVEDKLGRKY